MTVERAAAAADHGGRDEAGRLPRRSFAGSVSEDVKESGLQEAECSRPEGSAYSGGRAQQAWGEHAGQVMRGWHACGDEEDETGREKRGSQLCSDRALYWQTERWTACRARSQEPHGGALHLREESERLGKQHRKELVNLVKK